MNKTYLLGLACGLALIAGCATNHPTSDSNRHPPVAGDLPNANLLVISAVYGSGTHFVDVTYRVNDLLRQPGVEFFARPEWLHADPTPGWNKALVIIFDHKGQRRIFTAGEGGRVSVDTLLDAKKPKPALKRPQPAKAEKQSE
ncbi:MAG: hypothetical protein QM813_16735 [Verrucomicrobiota bacterium]